MEWVLYGLVCSRVSGKGIGIGMGMGMDMSMGMGMGMVMDMDMMSMGMSSGDRVDTRRSVGKGAGTKV